MAHPSVKQKLSTIRQPKLHEEPVADPMNIPDSLDDSMKAPQQNEEQLRGNKEAPEEDTTLRGRRSELNGLRFADSAEEHNSPPGDN